MKRIAFLGFPDDAALAKKMASSGRLGADVCVLLEGTQEGLLAAASFLSKEPKIAGEDTSGNILIVSSDLDKKLAELVDKVFVKAGISVMQSPVPKAMTSRGDGFGTSIYINETVKPNVRVMDVFHEQPKPSTPVQEPVQPQPVQQPAPAISDIYTDDGRVNPEIIERHEATDTSAPNEVGATFMDHLSEEDRRRQLAMAVASESFGDLTITPVTPQDASMILWVTGVSGGSGKTTLSYLIASVLAAAMKSKGLLNQKPVYVIEADFENSKWESRFSPEITMGRNISHYIRKYSEVSKLSLNPLGRAKYIEDAIDGSTFVTPSSVRVIPCPYLLRKEDHKPVSRAIGQIIRYLREKDGIEPIIIVDGSYPAPADIMSEAMSKIANFTVLTSANGNVNDLHRSLQVLTSELSMERSRISLFFMKCNQTQFDRLSLAMNPYSAAGFLPRIEELEDQSYENGAWVGNLPPGEVFDRVVLNIAYAIGNIVPVPELEDFVEFTHKKISATPAAQARSWNPFKRK